MKKLRKLSRSDISIGQPLPYSVVDGHGRLLLNIGHVITQERHVERLVMEGIFQDMAQALVRSPALDASSTHAPSPPKKHPPYLQGAHMCERLRNLYTQIIQRPQQSETTAIAYAMADDISEACNQDADGLLASLHVDPDLPYPLVHAMLAGVLAELAGRGAGISQTLRRSLVAAAITHDVAQIPVLSTLDRHQGPLTPELQTLVHAHPKKSCDYLRFAGVADPDWLDAIAGHHERLDGSGYPMQLRSDAISQGARLLAVCDVYSAMIKPRPYRKTGKAEFTQTALREIYSLAGNQLDSQLSTLLIKAIGVLPAGSMVKLENGEIAVVKNAGRNAKDMVVYSIYDARNALRAQPVRRRTRDPGYAVVGMAHYAETRSAKTILKQLWCPES